MHTDTQGRSPNVNLEASAPAHNGCRVWEAWFPPLTSCVISDTRCFCLSHRQWEQEIHVPRDPLPPAPHRWQATHWAWCSLSHPICILSLGELGLREAEELLSFAQPGEAGLLGTGAL